jgi:hypothetical protein
MKQCLVGSSGYNFHGSGSTITGAGATAGHNVVLIMSVHSLRLWGIYALSDYSKIKERKLCKYCMSFVQQI